MFSTQASVICNHLHFPLLSSLQALICSYLFRSITNIYHKDKTSERSVFLFSMVCSKAVFAGGCLGVPLRVGLSAASPRYAVGFPLQSLTWVKGLSQSCACTLAHGLFRPGVRFRPFRQAAWPKPDIGAERQTEHVRAITRDEVHHRHIPCQTIAFEDERE